MATIKITDGDFKKQKAKVEGKSAADLTITIDGDKHLVKNYILRTQHGAQKEKKSLMGAAISAGSIHSSAVGFGTNKVLQGIASGMDKSMIEFIAYLPGKKMFVAESETKVYEAIAAASPQLSEGELATKGKSDDRIQRMLQDAPRVILEVRQEIASVEPQLVELKKQSEEGATFSEREDALEKSSQVEQKLKVLKNNEAALEAEIGRQEASEKQQIEDQRKEKEDEDLVIQQATEKEAKKEMKSAEKKAKKETKSGEKKAKKETKSGVVGLYHCSNCEKEVVPPSRGFVFFILWPWSTLFMRKKCPSCGKKVKKT